MVKTHVLTMGFRARWLTSSGAQLKVLTESKYYTVMEPNIYINVILLCCVFLGGQGAHKRARTEKK